MPPFKNLLLFLILILGHFVANSQSLSVGLSVGSSIGKSDFDYTTEVVPNFRLNHRPGLYWGFNLNYEFKNQMYIEGEISFAQDHIGVLFETNGVGLESSISASNYFQCLRLGFPLISSKRLIGIMGVARYYNSGAAISGIRIEYFDENNELV